MKCRKFVSIGEPVSKITEQEHAAFLLQYQKSILASLKNRELLNYSQYERCILELERKASNRL